MGRSGQVLARAGPWARHVQHQPIRPVGHVPRAVSTAGNRTLDSAVTESQPLCESSRSDWLNWWPQPSACSEQQATCTNNSAAPSSGGGLGTAGTPSANRYEIAFKQGGASGKSQRWSKPTPLPVCPNTERTRQDDPTCARYTLLQRLQRYSHCDATCGVPRAAYSARPAVVIDTT